MNNPFLLPIPGRGRLGLRIIHRRNQPHTLKITEPDISECILQKTKIYGPSHQDTTPFDDSKDILEKMQISKGNINSLKIHRIHVWAADSVHGIQIEYKHKRKDSQDEEIWIGEKHLGGHGTPSLQTIDFHANEYITSVEGRIGAFMNLLTLRTNCRTLTFGITNAGLEFKIELPFHCKMLGFAGGKGGHIHNIGLVYLQMQHWSPENYDRFSAEFKAIVKTLLMLGATKDGKPVHPETMFWSLPKDVIFYILDFLAQDEFAKSQIIERPVPASI